MSFGLVLAAGSVHFFQLGSPKLARGLVDFDAFHVAGTLIRAGRAVDLYELSTFGDIQRAITLRRSFMPWTYPPPFDLVVGLLALLPLGYAYLAFIVPTLVAYLATLHRLCGRDPAAVVAILWLALLTTALCGQNGFLTGTLVGIATIGLLAGRSWAGIPLGLMVIKPHLAVGLAVYLLVAGRWRDIGVAAATVVVACLVATLVLGPAIWPAFFTAVEQASDFLARRFYPFHRMISPYAALRTFDVSATAALAVQGAVALTALGAVVAARFRLAPREALGVAVLAGLLLSPYAYDYDLPVLGVGLALVLPALVRQGRAWEVAAVSGLIFVAAGNGIVQVLWSDAPAQPAAQSSFVNPGGLLLVLALALIWRVLARETVQVRRLALPT